MKRTLYILSVLLLMAFTTGCFRSTKGTEVGIKVRKFFGDDNVVPPGQTVVLIPVLHDWYVYDQKLQSLEMRRSKSRNDALDFKTVDGNDIHLDVTIQWRVIPDKAPGLLRTVGPSMEQILLSIVRPLARSIPRDVFNELTSEQFYDSAQRSQKAREAQKQLDAAFQVYGLVCEQVVLGDYSFDGAYQQAIDDKKVADQKVNKNKSAAEAAREEWKRKLEETKGSVNQQIAASKGRLRQIELESDAYFEAKKLHSDAILTERTAQAEGLRKQRQAIAGSGGRTMVKLAIAEALKGKKIVLVPVGGDNGFNLQRTDVNNLLEMLGVDSEAKPTAAAAP